MCHINAPTDSWGIHSHVTDSFKACDQRSVEENENEQRNSFMLRLQLNLQGKRDQMILDERDEKMRDQETSCSAETPPERLHLHIRVGKYPLLRSANSYGPV